MDIDTKELRNRLSEVLDRVARGRHRARRGALLSACLD